MGEDIVNQPLPHQLTVGQLRRALEGVHDDTVIALKLPAGHQPGSDLALYVNLSIRVSGPVVILSPQSRQAG